MQPKYQVALTKELPCPSNNPWFPLQKEFDSLEDAEAYIQTLKRPHRPYRITKIEVVKETATCPCVQQLATNCNGDCGFNEYQNAHD